MPTTSCAPAPSQAALRYQSVRSDKTYHLSLHPKDGGWVVDFEFGRTGSHLQTGTKTPAPVPYREALDIYEGVLREKLGKGYHAE